MKDEVGYHVGQGAEQHTWVPREGEQSNWVLREEGVARRVRKSLAPAAVSAVQEFRTQHSGEATG